MWERLIEWLESMMMPCFYKKLFGIECPGCGMQRAFIELLKGNLYESIKTYPALIPTIIMVFYLFLHLIFKFKNGGIHLKYLFIFTASLMVINYIFKIIF